jgi:hypothetical protein
MPASERLQTHDLDRVATGIIKLFSYLVNYFTEINSILKKFNEDIYIGWTGIELWPALDVWIV